MYGLIMTRHLCQIRVDYIETVDNIIDAVMQNESVFEQSQSQSQSTTRLASLIVHVLYLAYNYLNVLS